MVGVARPDLVGPIDKGELGLVEVPVVCFAGFIFLNPDANAKPLAEFTGKEVLELLPVATRQRAAASIRGGEGTLGIRNRKYSGCRKDSSS